MTRSTGLPACFRQYLCGCGRVVFARSLAQLRELSPHPPTPNIIRKGPALFDEARVPIEAYGS